MFGNAAIFSNNFGDINPPSKPSLSSSDTTDTSIIITGSSTDNIGVVEYDVYLDSVLYDTIIGASFSDYSIGGLLPETNYDIYIIAKDLKGNESLPSDVINFTTDVYTPPLDIIAPTWSGNNLSYTAVTSTGVTLNWTAATDNVGVTGYSIYKDNNLLLNVGNVLTYDITGLIIYTTYGFKLKATDAAGNVSEFSNTISFTTVDSISPSKPTLSYHTLTGTSVMINGSASDNVGVVSYDVYLDGVFNKTITGAIFTNNVVTGLDDVTGYSIYITAKDAAGNESVASDAVTFTTLDATDPSKPSLTYANVTYNSVEISGTATDNVAVTYYKVYVDEVFSENVNGASLSSYVVYGLSGSTNYDIFIVAVDAAGNESLPSDIINFTTDAAPVTGTPVLSNFRIENAQPSRVYFDSSANVSGLTTTGFVISSKTISSVTVDVDGLGGYFTVSVPFTYWDNNTIRLGENQNLTDANVKLHNFTLEYIDNNINEPAAATNRYVTTTGTGNGLTIGTPASLSYAFTNAQAGQTWWVKAGNYGDVQLQYTKNGTPTSPIKFIGYKTTPGDINSMYWNYGNAFNTAEMPSFVGSGNHSSLTFLTTSSNIIVRNFQSNKTGSTTEFAKSFYLYNTSNIIFDNLLAYNIPGGYGFVGYGGNTNCRIINSKANHAIYQVWMYGQHCLIDNTFSYSGNTMQYLLQIEGNNNIVKNSTVSRVVDNPSTTGHGLNFNIINGSETAYNLAVDCEVINASKAIEFRKGNSHDNVAKRINIYGDGTANADDLNGITFRDGSFNNIVENIYENMTSGGYNSAIMFFDQASETGTGFGTGNIVRNSIFKNANVGLTLNSIDTGAQTAQINIYNCTFDNIEYLFEYINGTEDFINSNFINNSFSNISYLVWNGDMSGITWNYNNFYTTPTPPSGTGNTTLNPNFVNTTDFVPQTEMYAPRIEGVWYDNNGSERASQTTKGARIHANEVVGEEPPVTDLYPQDNAASTSEVNSVGSHWVLNYNNEMTIESSTTQVHNGTYSIKMYNPESSASSGAYNLDIQVTSGSTYTVTFWYYATFGIGQSAPVIEAGTNLSFSPQGLWNENVWTEKTFTATATATGTAEFVFYVSGDIAGAGNTLYIDEFTITEQ